MSEDGEMHVVRQGETTAGLAYRHGLYWRTVWQHARNSELRQTRTRQNVLYPGDELFLPALRLREESGATEMRHRFRRLGVPEHLNVQFTDLQGEPYRNEPYLLTVDGAQRRGKLDGEGWLRVPIPPDSQQASIALGRNGELLAMDLNVGHLDPVSELTGVQERLSNLGFYHGAIDGQTSDELHAAVQQFRQRYGLDPAPAQSGSPTQSAAGPSGIQTSAAGPGGTQSAGSGDGQASQPTAPGGEPTSSQRPGEGDDAQLSAEPTGPDPDPTQELDADEPPTAAPSDGSGGIDDAFRTQLRKAHGI